jgi:hypothetical protein
MRLWRFWSRWTWRLMLGAFLFGALPAAVAAADDVGDRPAELRLTVIKIGPQAVLIVDEAGIAMMYEDLTSVEPTCEDREVCWGFEAEQSAGVVISGGGKVVQGVDTGSGAVFEETAAPPP